MVLTRLTIDLYFKPSVTSETLRKLIQAPFKIHCERSDKGITLISIEHPTEIGTDNINTESYNHWYVDFIKTNYNVIKQCGLEEINIFIDVFFMDNVILKYSTINHCLNYLNTMSHYRSVFMSCHIKN